MVHVNDNDDQQFIALTVCLNTHIFTTLKNNYTTTTLQSF